MNGKNIFLISNAIKIWNGISFFVSKNRSKLMLSLSFANGKAIDYFFAYCYRFELKNSMEMALLY